MANIPRVPSPAGDVQSTSRVSGSMNGSTFPTTFDEENTNVLRPHKEKRQVAAKYDFNIASAIDREAHSMLLREHRSVLQVRISVNITPGPQLVSMNE